MGVRFEWDEEKSQLCFEQRGFDFAYVAKAFFDPNRVIKEEKRRDYGEKRFRLLGHVDDRLFVCICICICICSCIYNGVWRRSIDFCEESKPKRG